MTTKNYEKSCARVVQDACNVAYTTALRWVREHQETHPEPLSSDARALRIMESRDGGNHVQR